MPRFKANIDFSKTAAGDLAPIAQNVHDEMTAHAGVFASPPLAMATFQHSIDEYRDKLAARANAGRAEVVACRVARAALEAQLEALGHYVNLTAQGDLTIVQSSGFPYYGTSRPVSASPPAAPENVRLEHGTLSGQIIARYKPKRIHSMNEAQLSTGDPNLEADWQHAGLFSGGKAIFYDLQPGTVIWFRVRTAGIRGLMGAWSDPAKIMVV